jgi:hypothetical protein
VETCGTDELCDLNATTFQFGLKQDIEGLQIDLKMRKIRGIDTPESGGLLSFPGASRT